jgi:hypothetical protein
MKHAEPPWRIVPTRYYSILAAAMLVAALGWAAPGVWFRFFDGALDGLASGPVYSVTALRAYLTLGPQDWSGRAVLVRAALTIDPTRSYCPAGPMSCVVNGSPILVDPGRPDPSAGLILAWSAPDPLWNTLRRLPLVGSIAPRPQTLRWGRLTTYRVRLQASHRCRACAVVLLLDAQGDAWPS